MFFVFVGSLYYPARGVQDCLAITVDYRTAKRLMMGAFAESRPLAWGQVAYLKDDRLTALIEIIDYADTVTVERRGRIKSFRVVFS